MYVHVAREQNSEARVYGFDPVQARLVLAVGWLGGEGGRGLDPHYNFIIIICDVMKDLRG